MLPAAPPRFAVRAFLSARRALRSALDAIAPPELTLLEHTTAIVRAHALHAAASLRIADALGDRARTADDLARERGVDADVLDRTLRALVAAGIFARDASGRYRNNRVSRAMRADAEPGVGAFVEYFLAPYHARAWAEFGHTVRTGKSAFAQVYGQSFWTYCAEHPEAGAGFAAAMASLTRIEAPAVVAGYDFAPFGTVCDVAGGSGTLLGAILARHPRANGILFDHPDVLARADGVLAAYGPGVPARVRKEPGSFFERVPAGADAYLLKDILHDWDDAVCRTILGNVRRAAAPGARVVVLEWVVEPGAVDEGLAAADLQMATVCDQGRQRSREEFQRLFTATGFTLARVVPLPGLSSAVEAVAV